MLLIWWSELQYSSFRSSPDASVLTKSCVNAWSTLQVNTCLPFIIISSCLCYPVWPSQLSLNNELKWQYLSVHNNKACLTASKCKNVIVLQVAVQPALLEGACIRFLHWSSAALQLKLAKLLTLRKREKRELHKIFARYYSWFLIEEGNIHRPQDPLFLWFFVAQMFSSWSGCFCCFSTSFSPPQSCMKNDYYRNEHLIKVKYPHEAYGRKMKGK